jgi:curved DNA-binding protein CbpA
MVRESPDPYRVLGVPPTATQAEITHAYRARLRAHHPDTRHTPSSQTADEDLRQVLAAYALLRDPARRAEYDQARASASTPSRGPGGPIGVDHFPSRGVPIPITHRTSNTPTGHVATSPLRAGRVRWGRRG